MTDRCWGQDSLTRLPTTVYLEAIGMFDTTGGFEILAVARRQENRIWRQSKLLVLYDDSSEML